MLSALVVVLSHVVDRFVVGVVVFHAGGVVGACCMRSCVNLICCSFLSVRSSSSSIVALSGASSSILPSSSTFLMRRGDGVTLASKSLSVSVSGYFGDFNSFW